MVISWQKHWGVRVFLGSETKKRYEKPWFYRTVWWLRSRRSRMWWILAWEMVISARHKWGLKWVGCKRYGFCWVMILPGKRRVGAGKKLELWVWRIFHPWSLDIIGHWSYYFFSPALPSYIPHWGSSFGLPNPLPFSLSKVVRAAVNEQNWHVESQRLCFVKSWYSCP